MCNPRCKFFAPGASLLGNTAELPYTIDGKPLCSDHADLIRTVGVDTDRLKMVPKTTYRPFADEQVWAPRRRGMADDPAFWTYRSRQHKKLGHRENRVIGHIKP